MTASIHLSIHLSMPSIYPSTYLSIYLSTHLSIHLSIYLSMLRCASSGRQQATVLKSDNNKPSPATTTPSSAAIDPTSMMTDACARLYSLVEDVVDQWPHSVPHMTTQQITQSVVPSKVRGLTEEGGRMALSGMNGWAFFDYHLAMFGPQELPQGR